MVYLAVGILGLLLAGSAYSYTRCQQEAKRRSDLLYNEIIPCIDHASIVAGSDVYPSLGGAFENYRIIIVPTVDNLSLRRLPRLYLKVIIYVKNNCRYRILTSKDRSYLFTPSGFEQICLTPDENRPEIQMYTDREPQHKDFSAILNLLRQLDSCSEILIADNLLRVTFLAAKGQKSYYQVMRAAVFPAIVFKQQNFVKSMKLLMKLREEVAKLAAV